MQAQRKWWVRTERPGHDQAGRRGGRACIFPPSRGRLIPATRHRVNAQTRDAHARDRAAARLPDQHDRLEPADAAFLRGRLDRAGYREPAVPADPGGHRVNPASGGLHDDRRQLRERSRPASQRPVRHDRAPGRRADPRRPRPCAIRCLGEWPDTARPGGADEPHRRHPAGRRRSSTTTSAASALRSRISPRSATAASPTSRGRAGFRPAQCARGASSWRWPNARRPAASPRSSRPEPSPARPAAPHVSGCSAKRRDTTAIVAANDLLALGCYDALKEGGLTARAKCRSPAITTRRLDMCEPAAHHAGSASARWASRPRACCSSAWIRSRARRPMCCCGRSWSSGDRPPRRARPRSAVTYLIEINNLFSPM